MSPLLALLRTVAEVFEKKREILTTGRFGLSVAVFHGPRRGFAESPRGEKSPLFPPSTRRE